MHVDLLDVKKTKLDGEYYFQFSPKIYQAGLGKPLYQFRGCYWDKRKKVWLIPVTMESQVFVDKYYGNNSIPEETQQEVPKVKYDPPYPRQSLAVAFQDMLIATEEQLRIQRYSWRTIKSYLCHLRLFFASCRRSSAEEVSEMDIRRAVLDMVITKKLSSATQIQFLSAIRFWWERVMDRPRLELQLQPKKEKKLPAVLSQQEVIRLFQAVTNLKHRCILMIIYSGGLRLSEACRLRVADIRMDRGEIFIHAGKGRKDRFTTLSERMLVQLRLYLEAYQPDYWLFEGQTGGEYSTRSVQNILRRAVKKSGVNPMATVHTLRHSYATHLLEQGVSLRHIQILLGHESSRTTEIYTRVTNQERQKVNSPLDRLGGFENLQ